MAGGGARAGAFRAVILLDTNVVSAVMLRRPKPAREQPFTRMRPGASFSYSQPTT
jgi:hypothetical protein